MFTLLVITIALTPVVSASHLGNDLIQNYGFEDWDGGIPLNWTTPNSNWDIVQAAGKEGNYGLMLETNTYTTTTTAMVSESIEVEEDDLLLISAWVTSTNAKETQVRVRGYDDERKCWITIETFKPSEDLQYLFMEVPEDITLIRMRIQAGYVDDENKGAAESYFDEIRIIDPAVENAEFYLDEGVITKNETLTIGNYELSLDEVNDNKALIKVSASREVIDSVVVEAGELAELKKGDDIYIVFQVDKVFVNSFYSQVQVSQILAGRITSQTPTIHPVEEEGLVLYLPLEENTGFDTYDYSGENYHGNIYGAEWKTGVKNNALNLDGINDYIEIPSTEDKFEEGDYTFSLWTKSTGMRNSTKYIMCHYNWRFFWKSDTEIAFSLGRMNDENGPTYSVSDDVSDIKDKWIHIVGVYNPSENKILLYVNGELADEKDIGGDRIWTDYSNYDLLIGNSKHGVATFYEGLVDEVRIYDYALTQQEIKELMSSDLGLSSISSYQSNMSLEKDTVSSVGNGFQIKYSDVPNLNLALIDGEQTIRFALTNISPRQTLFMKNSAGTPVVKLNIDEITDERLNLTDIWVANETANVPVLKVKPINNSEMRAYEPVIINVTIFNDGQKTYTCKDNDSVTLYLNEDKINSFSISNNLAPGDSVEYTFELNPQKAGESEIKAVVSTQYSTESSSTTVTIEPPVNPPLNGIALYVEENQSSGIVLHLTLSGPGIQGESWDGEAHVSIEILEPIGSRTFYDELYSISGTGIDVEIPYEAFYKGDEQYVVSVKFMDAESSIVTKVAGEDGIYDPPSNSYSYLLLVLLAAPIITYALRKKFL